MPMQTKILTVRIITTGSEPLRISEHERGLLEEEFENAIRASVDMDYGDTYNSLKAVVVELDEVAE